MSINSLTMTYDQVARILEQHINAEVLRQPHTVTRIDPFDWDGDDTHQFALSLDPLPAEEEEDDDLRPPIQLPANMAAALKTIFGSNGSNGSNGHGPVTAVTAVTPVTPVTVVTPVTADRPTRGPASRIPDERRVEILRLFDEGLRQVDIAARLDLSQSGVNGIIAEHRGPGAARARRAEEQARRRIALEPADEANIIRLAEDGLAIAEIADQLEIDRKAVVNYLAGRNADPETTPPTQESTQVTLTEAPKSRRGGHPKLSEDDKFTIVRLRTEYDTSVKDLAHRFGVSDSAIYDVLKAERQTSRSTSQPATEAQASDL